MSTFNIVKAKEYKVKDGDTLDSVAKGHGMTLKELAKFNWGSDDLNKINTFLRDKVGCRTKSKSGDFMFTKNDDPGILYIPEDMSPLSFSPNTEHTIKVKPVKFKTFKTSRCMVKFRPVAAWKGEFGFDWLRDGDWGKGEKYESPVLDGGYKSGTPSGLTAVKAREEILKEFNTIKTELAAKPDYYVPYLNIFPEGVGGIPAPPTKAKLKLSITIEEEAAEKLRIEFPEYKDENGNTKYYFELESGTPDLETSVGKHVKDITIKCLKDFSSELEIKIIAETREENGAYKSYTAGKIIACPNDKSVRKTMKFVFVIVVSDSKDTGIPSIGAFNATELINLDKTMFQAMIQPEHAVGGILDLSNNKDFKKGGWFSKDGKFYTSADPAETGMNQDHPDFFPAIKKLYLDNGNQKYKDYNLIFAFGENLYDSVMGQATIGGHILIVGPGRDTCTTHHETLHGMGVQHSFKNDVSKVASAAKFTFMKGKTDNVMDYVYDNSEHSTWRWQWQIINK